MTVSTLILILLVLLLLGSFTQVGNWGYFPSGGLVVIILLVLLLTGHI